MFWLRSIATPVREGLLEGPRVREGPLPSAQPRKLDLRTLGRLVSGAADPEPS
ncbi:hypothetical protein C791_5681 [Amycolatopsis azurea DSM 43854]|uniref:Uncharacterized protein n=1 Tax=Amycolatopsis azurea DSM 43854 TaxID=1238180 RepID=M2QD18_9PSEU|nr:hypothetical protein C791_5681 [Amycolatopsis azurea DSM 43854]